VKLAAVVALVAGVVLLGVALADGGGEEDAPPAATATRSAEQPAAASPGRAVFAAHGCGSCHTFAPANASGTIGPDLTISLDGKPKEYIRESIVTPSAAAEPGWGRDVMPPDYASRMSRQDLDALVDFLAGG
jgi:mono/diheme cytochrome c family protein